jgi:hypothetical protein
LALFERLLGECLFVRAGTLDTPDAVRPDVHIFTRSRVPWLQLPPEVPSFQAIYKTEEFWPAQSGNGCAAT